MQENGTNFIDHDLSKLLNVFSAETVSGTEAEFINEDLPEKKEIVRLCRIILIGLYLVFTIYLIGNQLLHGLGF